VIEEVQIDDQPSVSPAKVSALGGVERVAAATVAGLARGSITQRQEQAARVLTQPPYVDHGI
jgi:hypothetical protein